MFARSHYPELAPGASLRTSLTIQVLKAFPKVSAEAKSGAANKRWRPCTECSKKQKKTGLRRRLLQGTRSAFSAAPILRFGHATPRRYRLDVIRNAIRLEDAIRVDRGNGDRVSRNSEDTNKQALVEVEEDPECSEAKGGTSINGYGGESEAMDKAKVIKIINCVVPRVHPGCGQVVVYSSTFGPTGPHPNFPGQENFQGPPPYINCPKASESESESSSGWSWVGKGAV